ncbi:MAG: TonB-dependent receptor plug domain-containing protein [Spirochaetes bacterium]|nr:TonB-dependent receptor plug domain-containing protein [Spirochaetota bacterium]
MKKIIICLIALSLSAMIAIPGGAQAAPADDQAAVEQPAEEQKEVEKKKSDVYTVGEIIIREKAIANVEDASTTTELSAESLKSRSEHTLDQALQTVPGMLVKQGRKGQMNFDMRGFGHNTVALLVDGLPFEEVYDGGGGDISRILVMNASKIVVNRGTSSALYGSRGAFGAINVITKKPDRLNFKGTTEFDQYGGFTVNASGGASIKNFYFWLGASAIKSNSYNISSRLGRSTRLRWMNRLLPWYVYAIADTTNHPDWTYDPYNPIDSFFTIEGIEYTLDDRRWNHTESMKYYASGKAGYAVNDNIEFGVSASYYQGEMSFNGFEPSNCSSYIQNGSWEDPDYDGMLNNRAWRWPKDYRVNVAPYLALEFGDFYMKAMYYFTRQANVLEGWTNQAQTRMFDMGKMSEHNETSHGLYVYPSYKFTSWNKLNASIHYRIDQFLKYKKRPAAYAGGPGSAPKYDTPWFKTAEMSAKYIDVALEDEFKFDTAAGGLRFSLGISYDAQMLSKNRGGRYNLDGWEDVTGFMRPRQKPESTALIWGTGDGFNPVFALVYEPVKDMLKIRGTLSQKTKFPTLHNYSNTSDYIEDYYLENPALLPFVIKLNEIKPETSYNANAGFELDLFEKALNLRGDYFYAFYRNKIEAVADPNTEVGSERAVNIKGREVHGAEGTITATVGKDLLKVLEMKPSATYVFTHARDWYDAPVVKGTTVAETPAHQVILQLALDFITGTGLNLWTNGQFNQSIYVQQIPTIVEYLPVPPGDDPLPVYLTPFYSTKMYTTKKLHDPFMFNIRVSQKIVDHFELWVMCKNILDDYNADPFNPGPGRTFYFGADAEF